MTTLRQERIEMSCFLRMSLAPVLHRGSLTRLPIKAVWVLSLVLGNKSQYSLELSPRSSSSL